VAEEPPAQRRPRGQDRRIRLEVKVNQTEREGLRARARTREVTVARLLVDAALERPLPAPRSPVAKVTRELTDELLAGLDRVRGELAPIGNNINQLAHAANIAGQVTAENRLEDALADYRRLVGELVRVSVRLARL
jgi:hypothetical protein